MAFEKGNTYGKGRPKGSKNKNSIGLRMFFQEFLDTYKEELFKEFPELDSKDKFKVFLDMAKYVTPSLRAVENEIEELSEEQFNQIVNKIKSDLNLNK